MLQGSVDYTVSDSGQLLHNFLKMKHIIKSVIVYIAEIFSIIIWGLLHLEWVKETNESEGTVDFII
jgi:hypothetical protein